MNTNGATDIGRQIRSRDFPVFSIYCDETAQTVYAINMRMFGRICFDRAEVIKNYYSLVAMHLSGEARDRKLMHEKQEPVMLDALVDAVRVGICFENYFKAKLMLADVLIHAVDHNHDRDLARRQRGEPIFVRVVLPGRPAMDKTEADGLLGKLGNIGKMQTINYSTILDVKKYVDVLHVPDETIGFLKQQNDARNDLHMITSQELWLGDEVLRQYKKLVRIVWGYMARLQNSLLDKITPGQ